MPEERSIPEDPQHDPDRIGLAASRLFDGCSSPEDRELLATAAAEAFAAGGTPLAELDALERTRVLAALLSQADEGDDPPPLHRLLANYDSGLVHQVLPNAAQHLGPIIVELLDGPEPTSSVVLAALVLRAHLQPFLDDTTVRDLHLATVASLSAADLTLPYSCAFGRSFDANRADLSEVLGTGSELDPTPDLPLVHRLVFEWLTDISTVADPGDIDRGLRPDRLRSTTEAEAAAAARSLAARHGYLGRTGDPGLDGDERLGRLRTVIVTERDSIPRSAAGSAPMRRLTDRRVLAALGARNLIAQRLPARIATPRRRPRVAVCVSGQLRGYQTALETWRRTLLRSADCELFVHTWSNVGRSGAEGFRATLPFAGESFGATYRSSALRIGYAEVAQRYPTLFAQLAAGAVVDADQLREHYGTPHVVVQDDASEQFEGWSNQDKMHWKIQHCHQLALDSGLEFDLVVRLRPDKPIHFSAFTWRDLLQVTGRSPTIFADHEASVHYAKLVIGDQFAVGAPGPMSTYSRTWALYRELADAGLHACPPELSGHSSLAQVCWIHGIDVQRSPMRFGDLLEASPMPSQQIAECLEQDASDRMDAEDRSLLAAVRADLSAR